MKVNKNESSLTKNRDSYPTITHVMDILDAIYTALFDMTLIRCHSLRYGYRKNSYIYV